MLSALVLSEGRYAIALYTASPPPGNTPLTQQRQCLTRILQLMVTHQQGRSAVTRIVT